MAALDTQNYTFTYKGRFGVIALGVGIVGIILTVIGAFSDAHTFFASWLTGFAFWTTLVLGALFFVMLQHATGAVWSVAVRRVPEALSMTLPVLLLCFIPLVLGLHDLFHWTHAEEVASDHLLQWKSPYLNSTFFIIRGVVFFAIWIGLAWMLNRYSLAQDADGNPAHTLSLRKLSAGGIFLFAFSITFAAFDWLMSLEPHWYSTIFGVYVFIGGFLASLAMLVLIFQWMKGKGILTGTVTTEHFHDFGRLMFAFTVFWAYIGGSQYYLIWYANIPEETVWFLTRWENGWKTVSMLLIIGHFIVPFITLIFYRLKRMDIVLKLIAALIVVMHFVDMFWLVMPTFSPEGVHVSWMHFTAVIGIGGLVLGLFWMRYTAHRAVPVLDPKLEDSIAHRV
ncbi:MAG: hypothetical protein C0600_03545 [Ignavibacteria bacterium]|nr:MAG: hypothetical protein C0600_03545 [Ignavibacteria bacterium]